MNKTDEQYQQWRSVMDLSRKHRITPVVAAHLFSLWSARRQNKECAKYK